MDIRSYIESGALEEYVLGKLTPQEAAEVEQNARLYPAVKQELDAIEQALERYAFSYAKTPPPGVIDHILQRIDAATPPPAPSFWALLKPKSIARFLAVGMTVKFLLAAAGLWILYLQNQKLHEKFVAKQDQLIQAQASCDSISNIYTRELRFLRDLNTQPVAMKGTPIAPDALAAVHFNAKERKVYLTNLDLPTPPSNKQYQLWAIVKDKPVSMGVFDLPEDQITLLEVPFVANASAFAISLEDTGGKPQPTNDQIYVLGLVRE